MTEWVRIALLGLHGLVSSVDGDSVRLWDNSIVRLKGFNTPEARSSCSTPEGRAHERALAAKATARLAELLKGRNVALVMLPEQCGHSRSCGILMSDDRNAKDVMIEEGLAEPMDCGSACPPPKNWCGSSSP